MTTLLILLVIGGILWAITDLVLSYTTTLRKRGETKRVEHINLLGKVTEDHVTKALKDFETGVCANIMKLVIVVEDLEKRLKDVEVDPPVSTKKSTPGTDYKAF